MSEESVRSRLHFHLIKEYENPTQPNVDRLREIIRENNELMEEKKCSECGNTMKEVGETGHEVVVTETVGFIVGVQNIVGVRNQVLYQCPNCKTVLVT